MSSSQLTALETALFAPLNNFLTALQQPGVNVQTAFQQVGSLSLSEVLALPGIESDVINLAAASLQAKLASIVAPPASPTTATPTVQAS